MQQNAHNNPAKHQDDANKSQRQNTDQEKGNPSNVQKGNQNMQHQTGKPQDEANRENRENDKPQHQKQEAGRTSGHGN